MYKASVVGFFNDKIGVYDGQGVKTNILTEELEHKFGADKIYRVNTNEWQKSKLKMGFKLLKAVWFSRNLFFLTNEGGIERLLPIIRIINLLHLCRIHYYVVGGWLVTYLKEHTNQIKKLKKIDYIYVEIPSMDEELKELGIENIILVNKFRRINLLSFSDININIEYPRRLCFFARILKEKGVEDAIEAIKILNKQSIKFTLDIYGVVDPDYKNDFEAIMNEVPSYIQFKGVVDFHKSQVILKDYYLMLFPTYYRSEGYPNTVVDAFAAGLPIIATKWNYNVAIIHDREDGLIVEIRNPNEIARAVTYLENDNDMYIKMRKQCLERCKEYIPEKAICKVVDCLK